MLVYPCTKKALFIDSVDSFIYKLLRRLDVDSLSSERLRRDDDDDVDDSVRGGDPKIPKRFRAISILSS